MQMDNIYRRSGGDGNINNSTEEASNQLSLRQLKRLWEGILSDASIGNKWNDIKIDNEVKRRIWLSQLTEFAPKAMQDSLLIALNNSCDNIPPTDVATITTDSSLLNVDATVMSSTSIEEYEHFVQIGDVTVPINPKLNSSPELIPNPLFFDVPSHVKHMESMSLTLSNGSSPLLLIGDQGTGKNKITDRLLQLMKLEREYMQLHRAPFFDFNAFALTS
jgi:hypothetical protein